MVALAEPWRPWRAVAARVLWTYYRAVKGREGAPSCQSADEARRADKRIQEWPLSSTVRGLRRAPAAAQQLVVFLHGYGADGNDLIEIGRAWQQILPHAAFVSPHAPEPCGQAPVGRQWFPLTFRDPNERWVGVNKAAPMLERFLDAELARHKLPPSALALVGFSQGTMMALHVGLRRAVRAGGDRRLFGSAGDAAATSMPKPSPPRSNPARRCCWSTATATTLIPPQALFQATQGLAALEVPVEWHLSAGVGHGIDAEGLRHGGEFLARRFGKALPHRRLTASICIQ